MILPLSPTQLLKILLGGSLALLAVAAGSRAADVDIRFDPGRRAKPAAIVKVAFTRDVHKPYDRYDAFIDYLNRRITVSGNPCDNMLLRHQALRGDDYVATIKNLATGKADIAFLSPYNYVHARRQLPLVLLGRLQKFDADSYGSVILVRDRSIKRLKDLQSYTFFYPSKSSTSGYLIPLQFLKDHGLDLNRLKKERVPGGHAGVTKKLRAYDGKAFSAMSNLRFTRKLLGRMPSNVLYPFDSTVEDIPFDAIVARADLPAARLAAYKCALGGLVNLPEREFRVHFPKFRSITGILPAEDSDYDSLRRAHATVLGQGVLRFGMTFDIEPYTKLQKVENYRPVQRHLFREADIFLEFSRFYKRGDSRRLVTDLARNELDLAELPPLAAGRALLQELPAVATLGWSENPDPTHYNAVLIQQKNSAPIAYPQGLQGVTVALVGPPRERSSASAYAFPAYELRHRQAVDIDIVWVSSAIEVVQKVSTGGARAGALAEYRLKRIVQEGLGDLVEMIPGSKIKIPSGAYVLGKAFGSAQNAELKAAVSRAITSVAEDRVMQQQRPYIARLDPADLTLIRNVYDKTIPTDKQWKYVIVFAGVLIAMAVIIFLLIYKPVKEPEG